VGTDAERRLWARLRNRQLSGEKFVRQYPVGPYFVDFACREKMLVVELDGGQHSGSRRDDARTAYLNAVGYAVLRFWNNEALANTEGVLAAILQTMISNPSPDWRYSPATLSQKGRGDLAGRL
jgi:very-short-patch-repair endonuclease